jgi:hypothetical protein
LRPKIILLQAAACILKIKVEGIMNLSVTCLVAGCISATGFRALKVALVLSLLLATASRHTAQANQASPGPTNAVKAVVSVLLEYPVVLVGEDHWLLQAGDFYIALVRDPDVLSRFLAPTPDYKHN